MNSPHMVSTILMVYSSLRNGLCGTCSGISSNIGKNHHYWSHSIQFHYQNPEPLIWIHHYQQHKLNCIQLGSKNNSKNKTHIFSWTRNLNSFCHCIFGQIYYTHEIHIYKLVKILWNYKNSTCILQCISPKEYVTV